MRSTNAELLLIGGCLVLPPFDKIHFTRRGRDHFNARGGVTIGRPAFRARKILMI
jgi:hypothetical protein